MTWNAPVQQERRKIQALEDGHDCADRDPCQLRAAEWRGRSHADIMFLSQKYRRNRAWGGCIGLTEVEVGGHAVHQSLGVGGEERGSLLRHL